MTDNNNQNQNLSQNQNQNQNPLAGINIYKPSGKGTLLSDLIKEKKEPETKLQQKTQVNKTENFQKYDNNYDNSYDDSYDDINIDNTKQRIMYKKPKMRKFKKNYKENQTIVNNNKKFIESDYVLYIFEIIIILSLYVILSQPFIISFLSKYINQLNPDETGEPSMSGIIIYGIVLAVLFLIVRKIVFSKL